MLSLIKVGDDGAKKNENHQSTSCDDKRGSFSIRCKGYIAVADEVFGNK